MKYRPNTNDPRVIKRIKHAYGYAIATFDTDKDSCRSQQAIDKRFGTHSNDLSKWLRRALLTCTDHHFSNAAKVSKKYRLNAEGVEYIRAVLMNASPQAISSTQQVTLTALPSDKKLFDQEVVNELVKREFATVALQVGVMCVALVIIVAVCATRLQH